jgi:hypothetical protein
MADAEFLDEVGLSYGTLFPSMGATAAANMGRIIAAMSPANSDKDTATRVELAKMFKMWATCAPAETRTPVLEQNWDAFYKLVGELAVTLDEPGVIQADTDYEGNAFAAVELAEGLQSTAQLDTTQAMMFKIAPLAYNTLEEFLNCPDLEFGHRPVMQNCEKQVNVRTELCSVLLRTMPYSGDLRLPNAFACITKVLLWKKVARGCNITTLKVNANSAMDMLDMVDKTALSHAGPQIMALVKAGGNDQLLFKFMSNPDIYTNNPEVVHDNLDIFLRQNYMTMSSVFNNIAARQPAVMIPHAQYFARRSKLGNAGHQIQQNVDARDQFHDVRDIGQNHGKHRRLSALQKFDQSNQAVIGSRSASPRHRSNIVAQHTRTVGRESGRTCPNGGRVLGVHHHGILLCNGDQDHECEESHVACLRQLVHEILHMRYQHGSILASNVVENSGHHHVVLTHKDVQIIMYCLWIVRVDLRIRYELREQLIIATSFHKLQDLGTRVSQSRLAYRS